MTRTVKDAKVRQMTDVAYNLELREFKISEPRIQECISAGTKRFSLYVHKEQAPVKDQLIAVVDPAGWRVEARIEEIVTPADFAHVGQVELFMVPINPPILGHWVECDNMESPTGWKWAPNEQ